MSSFKCCTIALVLAALAWPLAAATDREASPSSKVVLWQPGDPGDRLFLRGRVLGASGRPLAGAVLRLRQADGTGSYHEYRYKAVLETAEDGSFSVSTVLPGQYWGEKHIHVSVSHQGYEQLVTRILFKGDPNLESGSYYEHVILLEEVHKDGEKVLVGGVEFVLTPAGGN